MERRLEYAAQTRLASSGHDVIKRLGYPDPPPAPHRPGARKADTVRSSVEKIIKRERPDEPAIKWNHRFETRIKMKTKAAKGRDNEWKTVDNGVEVEQVSSTKWVAYVREDNLPHQLRRMHMITLERDTDVNGRVKDTYHEVPGTRKTYEVDIAVAQLCEQKLEGFRQDARVKYINKVEEITEKAQKEYEKRIALHRDSHIVDPTPEEEQAIFDDLNTQCTKDLKSAREECDKTISKLDDIYKNKKLDSQVLADLEQKQAKEANQTDLDRRIASIESKIKKNPEDLDKNAKAINKFLAKIAPTDIDIVDTYLPNHIATTITPRYNVIRGALKVNRLPKDDTVPDEPPHRVFGAIKELKDEFQRIYAPGTAEMVTEKKEALQELDRLFTERRRLLDEQHENMEKLERYKSQNDSTRMYYQRERLRNREHIENATGQLALAKNQEAQLYRDAERLWKIHTAEGGERAFPGLGNDAAVIAHAHAGDAFGNAYTDLVAQREIVAGHERQLALHKEKEETLKMAIDLYGGRYDTNEKREREKLDTIRKHDELEIQNRRKVHESLVANQRKLDMVEIQVLVLRMHARNAFMAAALSSASSGLLSALQRDEQTQLSGTLKAIGI